LPKYTKCISRGCVFMCLRICERQLLKRLTAVEPGSNTWINLCWCNQNFWIYTLYLNVFDRTCEQRFPLVSKPWQNRTETNLIALAFTNNYTTRRWSTIWKAIYDVDNANLIWFVFIFIYNMATTAKSVIFGDNDS